MYSREELDRIEAEWAFQLNGRVAFLDQDSFQALILCGNEGVPAKRIIEALQPESEQRQALRVATFPNILRLLL